MTTVLFAGGGTGGHIYPNAAIVERLRERRPDVAVHFLVSDRPGDAQTMGKQGLAYTASPVQPLPPPTRPWRAIRFLATWRRALAQATELLRREEIGVVVATGGFVSGPAVVAAAKLGIPRALVNLDAIPGKANRRLARFADPVFSTYETPVLPGARRIGLPLRKVSTMQGSRSDALARLGLDPDLSVLFVTGATHGAESVIRTMMALVASPERARAFEGWQVFHQCGTFDPETLAAAYADAGVPAKVVAYCDVMGLAWGAADLVVSRAGAGSVAEAWANAAPTVFLPNPYHRDQHQRHNAQPLVDAGGAILLDDLVDAERNVEAIGPALFELMGDDERRTRMRAALEQTRPPDGAAVVASWIDETVG
jgi:UDP-N-acetylglucosamine--N-acetylmuramyl-(pentapeptide) pyrophosphoryl-undecaprenol N-acetylglucosamine transferase